MRMSCWYWQRKQLFSIPNKYLIIIKSFTWFKRIQRSSKKINMSMEDSQQCEQMATGNEKTSDYYRTKNIPNRFENPTWFKGYGGKPEHPMYKTTANTIGQKNPSVHTMPTQFYCRSQKFSQHLGTCGMYRNHSLNTGSDKSKV